MVVSNINSPRLYERKLIPIIAVIVVLLTSSLSGCTTTQKPRSPPLPPNGPFIGARAAILICEENISKDFSSTNFTVPPKLRSIEGWNTGWFGDDAGNCKYWTIYYDGIMFKNSSYWIVRIGLNIRYENNKFVCSYGSVPLYYEEKIPQNLEYSKIYSWNGTGNWSNRTLDSHDIFMILNATEHAPKNYHLEEITVELGRYSAGEMIWKITWRYRFDYSALDEGTDHRENIKRYVIHGP